MYNVLKEKQQGYDQLVAANANMLPKFNYIKPNSYDMGHQQEAMDVTNYYSEASSNIAKLLQEDNLEGAKTEMMKAIYNKDMQRKIQYLEGAYNQEVEYEKSLSDIKDLGDRNRAYQYYQQNRLQGRNFEDYYNGRSSAVNSPLLGENPDLENIISKAGADINANGYSLADGSVLYSAKDANGNPTGKYMYKKGNVTSEIQADRAMQLVTAAVLSNPKVRDYMSVRNAWGAPIDQEVQNMIAAQALSRAHRKYDIGASYTDMREGFGYIDPDKTSQGIAPRTPVFNPFSSSSNSDEYKIENGKLFRKNKTVKTGGTDAAALSGGMALDLPMNDWEEYKPSEQEFKEVRSNYIKVIDPQTELARIVHKNSVPQGSTTMELNDTDVLNTLGGLAKSTNSTAWNVEEAPVEVAQKKYNVAQLNAFNNNSVQIRKQGSNGEMKYETSTISNVPADLEFYESGITVDHPEYGAGHKVYSAVDKEGNIYEIVGNKVRKGRNGEDVSYYIDKSNELNEFDLNSKSFTGVKEIDGKFFFLEKQLNLNQNQDDTYSSTTVPYSTMRMIENASTLEEAKKAINSGTAQFSEGTTTTKTYMDYLRNFYGYNNGR
jgi:hypothetical protein